MKVTRINHLCAIYVSWNEKDEKDRDKAMVVVKNLLTKGFITKFHEKMNKKFFIKEDEIELVDIVLPNVGVGELSSLMDILRSLGLAPSIYTRGKKFRFHVDAGKNIWSDHVIADEACVRAIKKWDKALRPIG